MKRIKKSKLIISIILLSLLIIEIITIGLSRASKTIDITLTAIDSSSALGNKEVTIEAAKTDDGNYFLTFPQEINGFHVKSYSMQREYATYEVDEEAVNQELEAANISINDIDTNIVVGANVEDDETESESNEANEATEANETNEIVEKSESQLIYENILTAHTTEIISSQSETYTPGTTVNLTNVERKSKKISATVTYDTTKQLDVTYYKQTLKANTVYSSKAATVEVTGYFPLNSKLVLNTFSNDQKANIENSILDKQPDDKFRFYDAYAPSILYSTDTNELDMNTINESNLEVFDTTHSGKDCLVRLSNLNSKGYYVLNSVIETPEDYTFAEIAKVEGQDNIEYKNTTLGKYALLYDPSYSFETVESGIQLESNLLGASNSDTSSVKWDGSVSTSFKQLDSSGASGNAGTMNNPYLITSGADLAYLAQRVNAGNTYANTYFKLLVNIDLDSENRAWTPIGNANNSFQGIFDGQGHNIINGVINNNALPGNNNYTYLGLFGTIGNSNSSAVVKNLEIKNFQINVTATGNLGQNRGYYIGSIVGGLFRNGIVENCVVSNSTINLGDKTSGNQGTLILTNQTARIMVGGAIGATQTANASYNDSGNAKPQVKAVHADVDIIADNVTAQYDTVTVGRYWWNQYTTQNNYRHYYSQNFSIGGVIGATIGERTCPEYCSYTGDIKTNEGFAGPIMGGAYSNNNANTAANTNNYRNNFEEIFSLSYLRNGTDINFNNYYYNYFITSHTITVRTGQNSYNNATNARRQFNQSIGTITGVAVPPNNNYRYEAYNNGNPTTDDSYSKYWHGINAGQSTNVANIYSVLSSNVFNVGGTPSSFNSAWEISGNSFNLLVNLDVVINPRQEANSYEAVPDPYVDALTYNYYWYLDGQLQNIASTNNTITNVTRSWTAEKTLMVICRNQDGYVAANTRILEQYEVHVVITESGGVFNSSIQGTGTSDPNFHLSDYTYQWYYVDIADGEEIMDGKTGTSLSDLVSGYEYEIKATNSNYPYMNASGSRIYGNRQVIYVNYSTNQINVDGVNYPGGNDNNDGFTPQTPVRTMATAYGKLISSYNRNENIIVVMGNYNNNTFINTKNSNTYNKEATLTGKYRGVTYHTRIDFGGQKFLSANTTFMYLNFYGNTTGATVYERAIYSEGYSLTMGKGLTMQNMGTYGTSQGCVSTCPGFQVCGPFQPATNLLTNRPAESEILILSGTYGRLLTSGREMDSNHNPLGNSSRPFRCKITIDIQDGVGENSNDYDVNLLTAGKNNGSTYSEIELNILNGKIGRLIGGNLGRELTPNNASKPYNSYFGKTTINMSGGSVEEFFGAGYGRNGSYDVYYYGQIEINITGGRIKRNQNNATSGTVYGGGAGGVTGYNSDNGDNQKELGQGYTTSISINISGDATIDGNVFGGGYGYSSILDNTARNDRLGRTYANTSIIVEGGTIGGNIYGAGQGYSYPNNTFLNVAQMTGNTNIEIKRRNYKW